MLLELLSFSFAARARSDSLVADDVPGPLGGFSTHALGLGLRVEFPDHWDHSLADGFADGTAALRDRIHPAFSFEFSDFCSFPGRLAQASQFGSK